MALLPATLVDVLPLFNKKMPIALTELPATSDPPRKRWTRAEYERLSAEMIGQDRLELVAGESISKRGKKRAQVNALILLQAWLVQTFGLRFVHPEAPIDVAPEDMPASEPEPDLIVTRDDSAHFRANPRPTDLLLVVEIADTTLSFDLTTKARLYARAGIAEYWVLDIQGRALIVHREPVGNSYANVAVYQEGEFVTPLAASAAFRVRDAFV